MTLTIRPQMRLQYEKAVMLLKNGTKLTTHTVGVFVAVKLIIQRKLDIMGGGGVMVLTPLSTVF